MIKNKRASYTGIFLLIILSMIFMFISAIFIYVGNLTEEKLHETMDDIDFGSSTNTSQVIEETFGKVNQSYSYLTWITVACIFAMMISILIGSYKVRTEPVYFIPYIIICIIAIIVSVGVANAYEQVIAEPTLANTFTELSGGSYFMLNLPMFITVIAFLGGIIMYVRWTTREDLSYYYG